MNNKDDNQPAVVEQAHGLFIDMGQKVEVTE